MTIGSFRCIYSHFRRLKFEIFLEEHAPGSHQFAHAYKRVLALLLENLLRSFVLNSYYLLYIMLLLLLQPPLPSKKSERILSDFFEGRGGCTQARCYPILIITDDIYLLFMKFRGCECSNPHCISSRIKILDSSTFCKHLSLSNFQF